ncbi:hypothetical protein BTE77_34785 [Ensifer adhaerens]|nr:hypothetical protein BTE77_34785 [Ensifer adhaerens]
MIELIPPGTELRLWLASPLIFQLRLIGAQNLVRVAYLPERQRTSVFAGKHRAEGESRRFGARRAFSG